MGCNTVNLGNGVTAIVCGKLERRKPVKCKACGVAKAEFECDWILQRRDPKNVTCDMPLCNGCRTSPAPNKDLCPNHAKANEARLAAKLPK